MNEKIRETVRQIVSVPRDFNHTDKSMRILLKESGYFDSPEEVTVEMLVNALRISPSDLDFWFAWSENKRTDSGWFLQKDGSGKYTVGYHPGSGDIATKTYTDSYIATANFIKSEIEDIRKST